MTSAVVLLCSGLVAAAPPGLKLAAPGWAAVGVNPERAMFYGDYFARQLEQQGVRVMTQSEMASLIGLEKQKTLMGCADASASCLAELGGALGAEGIISGSVARVERGGFAITLKILRVRDTQSMGAFTTRVQDEGALLDWLAQTARAFALAQESAQTGVTRPGEGAPGGVAKAWLPVGIVGLVAGGAGVGFYAVSRSNVALLQTKSPTIDSPDKLHQVADTARLQQSLGVGLMVAGGVGLAAASGLLAYSRSAATTVSVSWAPGSAALVMGGTF